MVVNTVNITGKVNLPPGNYYGTYSGHVVRIYSDKRWIAADAETGLKGTVNCLVKVDDNGSAISAF